MEEQFSLGIDIETGDYLKAPSSLGEVGELVEGWTLGEERKYAQKRDKLEGASQRPLLPSYKVDVNDLSQTGWAVIFAEGTAPAVREALAPLLDHRKAKATELLETGYREITGGGGAYRTGDSREDFLSRWNLGASAVVDPRKLPYYILLVGSPRQIPFEIQYELSIDYAVGRLWFDTPEEYARYARTILEAEAGRLPPRHRAVLFGPSHEGDSATQASVRSFIQPLGDALRQEFPSASIETVLAAQATKLNLMRLLTEEPPALLFTAGHATLCHRDRPYQRELQGALVCAGWRPKTAAEIEHLFTAADLPSDADLQGLVAFLFACSSVGTPDQDDFYSFTNSEFRGAAEPFLSRLPQRLLAQGAAAVIGHVDRAWKASFLYDQERDETGDIEAFKEMSRFLLDGYRVGHAMGPIARRHASLSAGVLNQQLRLLRSQAIDRERLGDLWLRSNDARNYLLLGDPAARLPLPSPDATS